MIRHSHSAIARAFCPICRIILAESRGKVRRYTHLICPKCDARVLVATYGHVMLHGDVAAEGVIIVQSNGYDNAR